MSHPFTKGIVDQHRNQGVYYGYSRFQRLRDYVHGTVARNLTPSPAARPEFSLILESLAQYTWPHTLYTPASRAEAYLKAKRSYRSRGERLAVALAEAQDLADNDNADNDDAIQCVIDALDVFPLSKRDNIFYALRDRNSIVNGAIERCGDCGELHTLDSVSYVESRSSHICESCLEAYYVYSSLQHEYLRDGDSRTARYYPTARAYRNGAPDYATVGSRSLDDAYCHEGDYFSESAYYDLDFHNDDDDDDDDYNSDNSDRCTNTIRDYHETRNFVGHIPSAYDNRKSCVLMGLELEMESAGGTSREDGAKEILGLLNREFPRYCGAERDGSLDDGFEVVTGYTGLDVHARVLAALENSCVDDFVDADRSSCGLHVHVDKADMTPFDASKMIAFIHNPDNRKLIECVARRYGDGSPTTGYAKFDYGKDKGPKAGYRAIRSMRQNVGYYGKDAARRNALQGLNEDRYEAINFQNTKTVEFRLFKGSVDYKTIMACLEFAFITWHFCRQAGLTELTDAAFCGFLVRDENRQDTKFLRAYLQERKHLAMLNVEEVRVVKDRAAAAAAVKVEPAKHVEAAKFNYFDPNLFALAA